MTFYETLKHAETADGMSVYAVLATEKFETHSTYELHIGREGYDFEVIHTAKTTWRKKFNEIVNEHGGTKGNADH